MSQPALRGLIGWWLILTLLVVACTGPDPGAASPVPAATPATIPGDGEGIPNLSDEPTIALTPDQAAPNTAATAGVSPAPTADAATTNPSAPLAAQATTPRPSSAPNPPASAAPPPTPGPADSAESAIVVRDLPRFGMTGPLSAADMTRAQELGAGLYTLGVFWSEIEPERFDPPRYDWQKYDTLFAALKARGLVPYVVLTSNPPWAYQGDRKLLRPVGREAMAQLVAEMVRRYGETGAVWSFYNEPDCSGPTVLPGDQFIPSTCWGNHGAEYTELLKVVYPAIKGVDPNALVALGGIAYDRWDTDFAEHFLDDVLASGGGAFFDLMNFHYYTEFADKWSAYDVDVAGKTAFLRAKLADYGQPKPIIISEISKQGTDEALQARYLIKGYVRALAAGSNSTIWFELRDNPADPDYGFGLLRGDGAEKPAARAFRLLTQRLGDATPGQVERPAVPDGAEAYLFPAAGGSARVLATWSDAGPRSWSIPAGAVTLETREAPARTVDDADDGQADGAVTITLTEEPLLISY